MHKRDIKNIIKQVLEQKKPMLVKEDQQRRKIFFILEIIEKPLPPKFKMLNPLHTQVKGIPMTIFKTKSVMLLQGWEDAIIC